MKVLLVAPVEQTEEMRAAATNSITVLDSQAFGGCQAFSKSHFLR